jgi:hypothetical protein
MAVRRGVAERFGNDLFEVSGAEEVAQSSSFPVGFEKWSETNFSV